MTDTPPPTPTEMSVRLAWPLDAAASPQSVNAFAVVPGAPLADSGKPEPTVFLVAGQTIPPVIADEISQREFAEAGSAIQIKPVVSLAFSLERAVELRDLLSNVINHLEMSAK